jgi:alpha-tubulin suppressor-like RCC1 family protein
MISTRNKIRFMSILASLAMVFSFFNVSPVVAAPTVTATAVSAGLFNACALISDGTVQCWGRNIDGQLGIGTIDSAAHPLPAKVIGLSGVIAVDSGGDSTCALTASGGVKCWGRNDAGQVGNGSTTDSPIPADVVGLSSGVVAISASEFSTCALMSGGTVKCWGTNVEGQLGNGTVTYTPNPVPVDVTGLSGVVAISTGDLSSCALTSAGAVFCWGYNATGALGNGTTTDSSTPVGVSGLSSGVVAISSGERNNCALTSGGGVKCWGFGVFGEMGNGANSTSLVPVDVSGLGSGVSAISSGSEHACALIPGGTVQCWGANFSGQLGNGSTTNSNVPVTVSGLTNASAISVGYSTCALTSVGGVECWGNNSTGALGNGTTTDSAVPVNVLLASPDSTPPVITPTITGTQGSNGWYTSSVMVSWSVVDNESTISSQTGCDPTTLSADTPATTLTCSATSQGGTTSVPVTIKIDQTAPTISAAATTAPNGAGWYHSNVTVHFTCNDAGSGITTCPADQVLSAEAAAVSSTVQTVSDAAGNVSLASNVVTVKIDKTAPTLNPAVSPNPVLLNGTASVTSGAADALSGLASQSCGALNTSSVGTKSVTCTAADNAGNSNSANVSYTVTYNFSGFLAPVNNPTVVNTGKAGRTYPVKWQLRDGNNGFISALTAVSSITYKATSCGAFTSDPTDVLETSATGATSLRYDSGANQYIYNWATPTSGCYTLFLTLDSGQVFPAFFNLTK